LAKNYIYCSIELDEHKVMEFRSKKMAEEECGPANALTPSEITRMIKLANITDDDVFYDLGSGYGRVVHAIIKGTRAKKSVGIENDPIRFCEAIRIAKRSLTKRQQKRTEFLCCNYELIDISVASVIYHGLSEHKDDILRYEKWFTSKRVRILKMDLPLVSYKAIRRTGSKNTQFFLMQYPLQKYKMPSKDEWASHVLDSENGTAEKLYDYYYNMLRDRGFKGVELKESVSDLKRLVRLRFPK
jgi:hypothetical protein